MVSRVIPSINSSADRLRFLLVPGLSDNQQKLVHDVKDQRQTRFKSNNPFNALLSQSSSSQIPRLNVIDPSFPAPASNVSEPSTPYSAAQREWEKFLAETTHRRVEVERERNEAFQRQTMIPIPPCLTCGRISSPAQNKPQPSHPFVDLLYVPFILDTADSPSLYAQCSHHYISPLLVNGWCYLPTTRLPLTARLYSSRRISCARGSRVYSVPGFILQSDHCSCPNRLPVYCRQSNIALQLSLCPCPWGWGWSPE
jgi:hypothetical protein